MSRLAGRAEGWGGARRGGGRCTKGGGENFSSQYPRSPFPGSRYPIGLGTDPTIVNKIKGLRGFGVGAGVEGRKAEKFRIRGLAMEITYPIDGECIV